MFEIAPTIRPRLTRWLTISGVFSVLIKSVLDIFLVCQKLQVFQSVIRAVQIFMVYLHAFRYGADKGFPHCPMNHHFDISPVFARTKSNVVVSGDVSSYRSCAAVAGPRFTFFNVKCGHDADTQKIRDGGERSFVGEHGLGRVHLLGRKAFPSRYAPHVPRVADFVQAFIAADRFPGLHTVHVKPVYVGGQA